MNFPFPFIDVLTIPTDAVPGVDEYVIIDGTTGKIEFYDSSNNLVAEAGVNTGFRVYDPNSGAIAYLLGGLLEWDSGDSGEIKHATLNTEVDGSGSTRRLQTTLSGAAFGSPATNYAELRIFSETADGSTNTVPTVNIAAINTALADFRINNRSAPRGLIANGRFSSTTTDDVARAAGAATDMQVTVALIANRLYKISLNARLLMGTASTVYGIDLQHDGTNIKRFLRPDSGDSTERGLAYTVDYVPTADDSSATLRVVNSGGSGGTIQLLRQFGERSLIVTDHGEV